MQPFDRYGRLLIRPIVDTLVCDSGSKTRSTEFGMRYCAMSLAIAPRLQTVLVSSFESTVSAHATSLRVCARAGRSATIHACLVIPCLIIQIARCDQRLMTARRSEAIQIRRSAYAATIGGLHGKRRANTDAHRKREYRKRHHGIRFDFTTPLCTNAPRLEVCLRSKGRCARPQSRSRAPCNIRD